MNIDFFKVDIGINIIYVLKVVFCINDVLVFFFDWGLDNYWLCIII